MSFTLPAPTGPVQVGTLELHLVDDDRGDPHAPEGGPRELVVSLWYPARHRDGAPLAPHLPRRIASFYDQSTGDLGIDAGDADFRGATSHAQTRAPVDTGSGRRPVVLYSSGGGLSRALGTSLVEDLASHGYVVVTVDSTYEAPVEFPDGLVLPVAELDAAEALAARVLDLRFVLNTLEAVVGGAEPDAGGRELPDRLASVLDLDHVGALGHSLGGFAVAEAMRADPRIDAGVNLDGSMPTALRSQRESQIGRPFLLVGAGTDEGTGNPHHHLASPDWAAFWADLTGWRRDLHLPGAEHLSFTDLQTVLPQLDAALDLDEAAVTAAIGSVDPAQSLSVQRTWLAAFFDQHLRALPRPVLDAAPDDLPAELIS